MTEVSKTWKLFDDKSVYHYFFIYLVSRPTAAGYATLRFLKTVVVFFRPEVIYWTVWIEIINNKIVVKSHSYFRRLTSHIILFTYLVVVLKGDDFVGAACMLIYIEVLEWESSWVLFDRAGEVRFDLFCSDELSWIGCPYKYCPGGLKRVSNLEILVCVTRYGLDSLSDGIGLDDQVLVRTRTRGYVRTKWAGFGVFSFGLDWVGFENYFLFGPNLTWRPHYPPKNQLFAAFQNLSQAIPSGDLRSAWGHCLRLDSRIEMNSSKASLSDVDTDPDTTADAYLFNILRLEKLSPSSTQIK
jgi:hypothetical protein